MHDKLLKSRFIGRIWNNAQTASYLGKSQTWLRRHRNMLERAGFPKVDTLLGGRDSYAVIRFCDQRGKTASPEAVPNKDILQLRAKVIANDNKPNKT